MSILRIRDQSGAIRGVPAIVGPRGPKGEKGEQGPQGLKGEPGISARADTYVTFHVNDSGHLICEYASQTAPGFSINDEGHLIIAF